MAVKDGGEGEAIEGVGPDDYVVFHLFAGALQLGGSPSDPDDASDGGGGVDGDGGAAAVVVLVSPGVGRAAGGAAE